MQVAKWGNSLAVRLPVSLVQELGIADGDELLLQPAPRQGSWGADFVFDRDEANAR